MFKLQFDRYISASFSTKISVVFYFRVLCASFSSYGACNLLSSSFFLFYVLHFQVLLCFVFEFIVPVLCATFRVLGACILFLLSLSVYTPPV